MDQHLQDLPAGFAWGLATAAYRVEDAEPASDDPADVAATHRAGGTAAGARPSCSRSSGP